MHSQFLLDKETDGLFCILSEGDFSVAGGSGSGSGSEKHNFLCFLKHKITIMGTVIINNDDIVIPIMKGSFSI